MKQYKAYCLDLDGTVYRGKQPIPSAISFIKDLQAQGIEPFYVTNNSSKTREHIQHVLRSFGVEVPLTHIYSSAFVTAKYIAEYYRDAKVYVIGLDGLRQSLEEEGIEVLSEEAEHADVLVMGIDWTITYDKIVHACKLVQNGAKLIGTNPDIHFPSEQYFIPGCGSFVELVAKVSKVEPLFIGKPSTQLLNFIQKEHKFTKSEMVMIGDNYHTDILCGINFGCDTIHVNTGVNSTEYVQNQVKKPTKSVEYLSI